MVTTDARVTIRFLLFATFVAAVAFCAYSAAPEFKLIYAADVVAAGFVFASVSHVPGIWPLRNRLTTIDLVTLATCFLIIHGTMIPSPK